MGMYAFIFACISVGLLLWFVSGSFDQLGPTMVERLNTLGTVIFVVGIVSLALVFFGIFKRG